MRFRSKPANLLTRSLPDTNSGVFLNNHVEPSSATRKHSVLSFGEAQDLNHRPLGYEGVSRTYKTRVAP